MEAPKALQVSGFEVLQYLGSGARSTVWQIRDVKSGDLYALKRVLRRASNDARFVQQAINEYEVGVQLDHLAVRKFYKIRRLRRLVSLREVQVVMEWCEGQNLQESRPKDIREILTIFSEVAGGLAHMNAKGFVHADMKPNNIVVSPSGVVKIIDLGQSCPLGTIKQRIQGTPDYIAPEQVTRQPLDGRTDIFNFGAALYWALTGRAVPTALPTKGAVTLKAEHSLTPPEQINGNVPASLSKLICDCIEFNMTHRPASMKEVGSRLNLILHTLNRTQEA